MQPRVTALFTTPIKGFGLSAPDSITLDSQGAVGDRDLFVIDDKRELLSITRSGAFAGWSARFDSDHGALRLQSPEGDVREEAVVNEELGAFDFWGSREVPGHLVGGPWSAWLSEIAGQPVSLVRAVQPGGAYDEAAVTMVAEESVEALARSAGTDPIDLRRFRMLINIAGVEPYEEETWQPRRVRIGTALLSMGGPVPRCNATTRNPDTGTKDLKTLKLIADARGMQPNEFGEGLNMGAYATVVEPGDVAVGDPVEIG